MTPFPLSTVVLSEFRILLQRDDLLSLEFMTKAGTLSSPYRFDAPFHLHESGDASGSFFFFVEISPAPLLDRDPTECFFSPSLSFPPLCLFLFVSPVTYLVLPFVNHVKVPSFRGGPDHNQIFFQAVFPLRKFHHLRRAFLLFPSVRVRARSSRFFPFIIQEFFPPRCTMSVFF